MNTRPRRVHRRDFLKQGGTAALAAGLAGCAAPSPHAAARDVVRVRVEARDPLSRRAFAIVKDRIEHRCSARVTEDRRAPHVILAIDPRLPADAFRIDVVGDAVRVAGRTPRGLLYGVGKFLRTSGYQPEFQVSPWRGTSRPRGSLRGVYFATHFHNWYHQASAPEIARYLEDLALWGINAVMVIFPMINLRDWDDPEAGPAMAMVRNYARSARELGMEFATGVNNNMFTGAPAQLRATRLPDPTGRRGNSGHPICPSLPEGHAYLMDNAAKLFGKLSDVGLDILCHWPYDEGGCACAKCAPWGSNGYLKLSRDLTELGRRHFPKLKSVLATWMFDTPPEGEWQGLTEAMARDRSYVDYILADAHEDFPRYPLDHGVPGNLPLLNFPEISMWGNWPWGGFGANPLPSRFQRLWDQVKHVVAGGFPYSEGIYEDLNKAVVAQYYWDPDRSARDTLAEYASYEFGAGTSGDVLALVDQLETHASLSFRKQPVDAAAAAAASRLAESLDARLPAWARTGWRWEILNLRAVLDRERFGGGGLASPAAESAMLRLMELYHCQLETDDPYHHRVRPPLRRAVSRSGNS